MNTIVSGMQSDEQAKTKKMRQNREKEDIDVIRVDKTFRSLSVEENSTESDRASDSGCETLDEDVALLRVPDDLINNFCDKLQRAYAYQIEGMFAIQYLSAIVAPQEEQNIISGKEQAAEDKQIVQRQISGQKQVLQVLFEAERVHYLLIEWDPSRSTVILYDSLQSITLEHTPYGESPTVPKCIVAQIICMFEHLHRKEGRIRLEVCMTVPQQSDGWSCGYRALAAVCLRAKKENVGAHNTNLERVRQLLDHITEVDRPTLRDFDRYDFRVKKPNQVPEKFAECYILLNGGEIQPVLKRNRTDSNGVGPKSQPGFWSDFDNDINTSRSGSETDDDQSSDYE